MTLTQFRKYFNTEYSRQAAKQGRNVREQLKRDNYKNSQEVMIACIAWDMAEQILDDGQDTVAEILIGGCKAMTTKDVADWLLERDEEEIHECVARFLG